MISQEKQELCESQSRKNLLEKSLLDLVMRFFQTDFKFTFKSESSAAEISGLGNLPNPLSWVNFHYISVVPSDNLLVKYPTH